jgi:hypothetical protein
MKPVLTRWLAPALLPLLAWSGAAFAQAGDIEDEPSSRPAAGTEVWASTDSEGTTVLKTLGRALWDFDGREKYYGIAAEHVWFDPASGEKREDDRVYLDFADHLGPDWRWRARVGTDGDTVLGNAELRRADWSQSFFIEREIVETDQGLTRGIYYTFAGASSDITISDQSTLAVTAGVQEFTGKNERLHLRGRLIHTVEAEAGLSAHLDARYYHSTQQGEFDYFSPKDFIRLLPLVQLRRRNDAGWMFLAAGGVGAQKSTGADWSTARFGQLRLESPPSVRNLDLFAELVYANESISGGTDYDYLMGRAGVTFVF